MPNLSEHLSSAETTSQLSARFGYAAAMKSINNLLLLRDGETWNRQRIDFAGLPEMVKTFLQVAAGAADIPVTRLLGQSPAGLSATGESDTRHYYDMVAARQELELRPALERLDRIIAASEGIDPGALTFAFRPLWQLDAATAATIALQKAQATQVYAGLNLWPAATTARLVQAQLAEDGTYPNAKAVFGDLGLTSASPTLDFDPDQPRDPDGRWTTGAGVERAGETLPGASGTSVSTSPSPPQARSTASGGVLGFLNALNPIGTAQAEEPDPDEESRRPGEPSEPQPGDVLLLQRYDAAATALREIDPNNPAFNTLRPPDEAPSENEILALEQAARDAYIARTCDFVRPDGRFVGQAGTSSRIRLMPGGGPAAQQDYDYLSQGGTPLTIPSGLGAQLPYSAGTVVLRWSSTSTSGPAIDVRNQIIGYRRLHY